MNGRYAKYTRVPVGRSQDECRSLLLKYKADGFAIGWEGNIDRLSWTWRGVHYTLSLERPKSDATHRQRWRAIVLVIKAKLEAVECGISTVEREFLAWAMGPDGTTLGDMIEPKLLEWSKRGLKALPLLPENGGKL